MKKLKDHQKYVYLSTGNRKLLAITFNFFAEGIHPKYNEQTIGEVSIADLVVALLNVTRCDIDHPAHDEIRRSVGGSDEIEKLHFEMKSLGWDELFH